MPNFVTELFPVLHVSEDYWWWLWCTLLACFHCSRLFFCFLQVVSLLFCMTVSFIWAGSIASVTKADGNIWPIQTVWSTALLATWFIISNVSVPFVIMQTCSCSYDHFILDEDQVQITKICITDISSWLQMTSNFLQAMRRDWFDRSVWAWSLKTLLSRRLRQDKAAALLALQLFKEMREHGFTNRRNLHLICYPLGHCLLYMSNILRLMRTVSVPIKLPDVT